MFSAILSIFAPAKPPPSNAKNIIDSNLDVMVSALNSTVVSSAASSSQRQSISVVARKCPHVKISHVSMGTSGYVSAEAITTAIASADVQNTLEQKAKQMARMLMSDGAFGAAESKNITDLCANLTTVVSNTMSQTVTAAFSSSQSVDVRVDSCDEGIDIAYIDFQSFGDAVSSSVMNNKQVINAKNSISQYVDQVNSVTAKPDHTALIIMVVFALIIVAITGGIIYHIMMSKKSSESPPLSSYFTK